jgi:pimeloyl-ACP methyl ester carboxylesterase/DNA-binding NarL/FixJ family response regulator
MADPKTPLEVHSSHKAEIIDRLYEVAIDPVRFEELLDTWEGRIAPLREHADGTTGVALSDNEIEAHFERASIFLDRYEAANSAGSSYQAALDDIGRSASFVSDGSSAIVAVNSSATKVFGIVAGSDIYALPFDRADIEELIAVIARVARQQAEKAVTMRLRSQRAESPVILRIMPVTGEGMRPLALVLSTELAWPEGFDQTMQEAFGLTDAEIDIVRGITEGKQIRDIAAERRRSAETVRTQLRSILAKTETHSQSELVRVTLNLMDVVTSTAGMDRPAKARVAPGPLEPIPFSTFFQPGNRRYDFIEFGDPKGAPCLYMHLDYGFIRWPRRAEQYAADKAIRVVVPVRAGFGASGQLPLKVNYREETALDTARLLDHLGIDRVAVMSQGADLRFAMELANANPGLVTGILGLAGTLPVQTAAQYERMEKWHRFILANARYAPRVLPFLVKAGFSLARRIGKEQFFKSVNGGSPGDMKTFADPEVREAILLGSEVSLSNSHIAHAAFARECLDSEVNWAHVVHACEVPVTLLCGMQDPQSPRQTILELMDVFPHLNVIFVEDAGQLVFFQEQQKAFDLLEPLLPRSQR